MSACNGIDLPATVTAEFLALAELLDDMDDASWNTLSLCAGWRVREVVAHVTMPVRYSPAQFQAELQDCGGDFTKLSNRIASRDAMLPTGALVECLRDEAMHHWTPPGGGDIGALTHVVIHGLDITVPLGRGHRPDEALRTVLDDLTTGGTHLHFGVGLDGVHLRATDMDWRFGSGHTVTGAAEHLALVLCGRALPAGRVEGELRRAPVQPTA